MHDLFPAETLAFFHGCSKSSFLRAFFFRNKRIESESSVEGWSKPELENMRSRSCRIFLRRSYVSFSLTDPLLASLLGSSPESVLDPESRPTNISRRPASIAQLVRAHA